MAFKKIILNDVGDKEKVIFEREHPYIKFEGIRFSGNVQDLTDEKFRLRLTIEKEENEFQDEIIDIPSGFNSGFEKLNYRRDLTGVLSATVSIEPLNDISKIFENNGIEIVYDNINRLDISKPYDRFFNHISPKENIKIFFSGPFGQGKSTFLDYFFEDMQADFRVFKLYPVNYSVSSNEDIFEYIKFDLLYQLLSIEEIQFNDLKVKYSDSFIKYFNKKADYILAAFVAGIPKIGKPADRIIRRLLEIKDEFLKEHDSNQDNELERTVEFLVELTKQTGSIYENDYYTILIRSLLDKLKRFEPDRQSILVIDDLDRMDPEHIFRVLNIFSAHYDSFQFENENGNNKFGFDKIVLVGDYRNLENIYAHRYGRKTDFAGYINKYYSSHVFEFDNKAIYKSILDDFDLIGKEERQYNRMYQFNTILLKALVANNSVKLRELLKIRRLTLNFQRYKLHGATTNNLNHFFRFSPISPSIMLISELGSSSDLEVRIKSLKRQDFGKKYSFEEAIFLLLTAIKIDNGSNHQSVRYGKYDFKGSFDTDIDHLYELKGTMILDIETSLEVDKYKILNFDLFKELLVENIKYFESFKHEI